MKKLYRDPDVLQFDRDGPPISERAKCFTKLENAKRELARANTDWNFMLKKEREAKGIKSAYVGKDDLMFILPAYLASTKSVTSIFSKRESTSSQVNNWAKRAVRTKIYKKNLLEVVKELDNNRNPELLLMRKYDVFLLKPIIGSSSHSAALKEMRAQLKSAKRLEQKDNALYVKDKTIADKDKKINQLENLFNAIKAPNKKQEALRLRLLYPVLRISEISKSVGLGRTTLSTFFNLPENKEKISNSIKNHP
jgi:hypothetical protein